MSESRICYSGRCYLGKNLLVFPMGASVGPAGGSMGDGVGAALLGAHTSPGPMGNSVRTSV